MESLGKEDADWASSEMLLRAGDSIEVIDVLLKHTDPWMVVVL